MNTGFSRIDQDRIVDGLADLIAFHYVFAPAAHRIAGRLRQQPPPYSGGDRAALAESLTALLRPRDGHFKVRWHCCPAARYTWLPSSTGTPRLSKPGPPPSPVTSTPRSTC
jgi:hypothetical protein